MPAIASIKTAQPVSLALIANRLDNVLKTAGDAAIGISRTYDPAGFIQGGIAKWVDRSGGIAVGYPSITLFVRPPSKTSAIYKVSLKISLPTLDVTSPSTSSGIQPQPSRAYDTSVMVDFMLPERGVKWERIAVLDTLASLLATTITASDGTPTDSTGSPLRAAVEDFDQPY